MLSIILKILSILGIILLVLLALIVVILLLVLFFPICYRIKADKHPLAIPDTLKESEETTFKQQFHADAKTWWLFGLLRAWYRYPDPGALKVKFLFFTIYDSKADKDFDHKLNKVLDDELQNQTTESGITPDKQTDSASSIDKNEENNITADNFHKRDSSQFSPKKEPLTPEKELQDSQNLNLFEKIQYTIEKIYDKIKSVFAKIRNIRENIAYYKEILTEEDTKELLKHAFVRLGKILKSLRPRKLRANILYGAASPDTTGYACAVYGMIAHHLGKYVIFTPDFENEILEGEVYAAGHTTIFLILWNLLMLVKDKRLWKLRDKLSKNK